MSIKEEKFSEVKIENVTNAIMVPISTDKPGVPAKIQVKWQKIVDLMARSFRVPSGQVTRFAEDHLAIVVANGDPRNPNRPGARTPLGSGVFCETVADRRAPLIVNDVRTSPFWENNPDASRGMLAYIGEPIHWEGGELFGTVCFLDDKPNEFSPLFLEAVAGFREVIEADLQSVLLEQELRTKLSMQQMLVREAHHRINNHFSMLIGYIQLRAAERIENRDVHDELVDIQNRIRSVALIHEKLCLSTRERMPPLDTYIAQLSDSIITDVSNLSVPVYRDVAPFELATELTVAIGIIVSELMTNSIKYAFKGIGEPRIDLTIKRCSEKQVQLLYRDNGVGLPADFDINKTNGLGMTIIRMQVEQLNGSLEAGNAGGAEFRMVFDG